MLFRSRRIKNVILTAEGERVADVIRAKMRTTQEGLDRLSDQERDSLYTLLERVFISQPAA